MPRWGLVIIIGSGAILTGYHAWAMVRASADLAGKERTTARVLALLPAIVLTIGLVAALSLPD